jgi:SAM-dependent methyltransferase
LQSSFKDYGYNWDTFKEKSCDWIVRHVPEGVGADLGGTAHLVKTINSMKNRKSIFYDFFPPKDESIVDFVADDMDQFANHFDSGSLDFVTSRHTLEHSLNPLFILWQINRTLRDKGRLIVVVPEHSKGWVWFYSHFSCLPRENWLMLFHRAGFKLVHSDAGTWQPHNPDFIEYRFVLEKETDSLRLQNGDYKNFRI